MAFSKKILQISTTHYFVLVDAEGLADSTLVSWHDVASDFDLVG